MQEGVFAFSDQEEHFGVPWKMDIIRKDSFLFFYLHCLKSLDTGAWSVRTHSELKIIAQTDKVISSKSTNTFDDGNCISKASSFGWIKFNSWEEIKKDYLINDKLTVEANVTIEKMTGFHGPNLRKFDESAKDISDFVITVGDTKFNVSQLLLASQSTYLKTLVLEQFKITKHFKFTHINAEDFQKFLEVLYGDPAINENTVEGIVAIGLSLTTLSVIRRCEEFLIEKSKKTLKKKLQMSTRYGLTKLKTHSLASMKCNADVRSVLPSDISQMDRALLETLFQKAVSFN